MRYAIALLTASIASAQMFPFPGPGRAGSGGGGGSTPNAAFVGGTNVSGSESSTTIATTSTLSVSSGDLVVVIVGGFNASGASTVTVACGADTLTETNNSWYSVGEHYIFKVFYKIGASANASATCTATFSAANTFRAMAAANYSITGTVTFDGSSCHDATCNALAASSTSRTAQNVTTTKATSLLVAVGMDWNGSTHSTTPPNGYALRIDADTPFWYDKVVTSTGSHPAGNFGTLTTAADQYMAKFVVFGIV